MRIHVLFLTSDVAFGYTFLAVEVGYGQKKEVGIFSSAIGKASYIAGMDLPDFGFSCFFSPLFRKQHFLFQIGININHEMACLASVAAARIAIQQVRFFGSFSHG